MFRRLFAVILLAFAAPVFFRSAGAQSTCDTELCGAIANGQLSDLRWPDFSDLADDVRKVYEATGYRAIWFERGAPTSQAKAAIDVLADAASEGLDPEDYDGSRWAERLRRLPVPEGELTHLDLALTVCMLRYVSDLHFGKLNPGLYHSQLDSAHAHFDLPGLVRQLAQGQDPSALLADLEPPFRGYQEAQKALQRYTVLAREGGYPPLPSTKKPFEPGGHYDSAAQLANILRRLGDLPSDADVAGDRYAGPLVEAVKHFQFRHGIDPDGRIGKDTLRELNTPLERRVKQLQLALERWRWAPHSFERPPVVVNIPEFRLRAFDAEYRAQLDMKVVTGEAYHHETPVFAAEMTYLTFRPYWHVPLSIQRKELLPEIRKDRYYLEHHGYEVVNARDEVAMDRGKIDDATLDDLRSGKLELRQVPGDKNALGLVAFMFPNEYQVYMHATPATSLFAKTRRDFSHGCIRVEKPVELAEWVLRGKAEWNQERILEAMHGNKTFHVRLEKPIPVLIVYATAVVVDGEVHFFPDIYGQDEQLEALLAKGYPTAGKKP